MYYSINAESGILFILPGSTWITRLVISPFIYEATSPKYLMHLFNAIMFFITAISKDMRHSCG